jgi:sortase A
VRVNDAVRFMFPATSNRVLEARFGLPQTGIENIVPVLAIIGVAIGFLMIIVKETHNLMKRKTKRRSMFITYVGILTVLGSVTVYGLDFYEDYQIYSNNLRTNQILRKYIEEHEVQTVNYYEEDDDSYEYAPGLLEIDGEFYLGILNISALGLELPVNNEWSDEKLNVSPCRFYGDFNSSLVICAHNYKFHFGNIPSLSAGDRITITDAKGNEHAYVVELIEIIAATDVYSMINTQYDLTLFTCTPDGGKSRITVRCMRERKASK